MTYTTCEILKSRSRTYLTYFFRQRDFL